MILNRWKILHRTRPSAPVVRSLVLALGLLSGSYASAGIIQTTGQSGTNSNVRVNVTFEKVDAQQHVILKYGAVLLKTNLRGLKLKPGAAGVLSVLLPKGVSLWAEIVAKGTIQTVILTKQGVNINDQLLIQGVAEGIR